MLSTLPQRTSTIRTISTLNAAIGARVIRGRMLHTRITIAKFHAQPTTGRRAVLEDVELAGCSRNIRQNPPSALTWNRTGFSTFLSNSTCARQSQLNKTNPNFARGFHSSGPNRGVPIVVALVGALKVRYLELTSIESARLILLQSSTALGVLSTTFRVALTFSKSNNQPILRQTEKYLL
jgi:hypothetical protein